MSLLIAIALNIALCVALLAAQAQAAHARA